MVAKHRSMQTGYVYVLGVPDGPYKVGFSLSPDKRAQAFYRDGHRGVHVVTKRPLPWTHAKLAERYAHWLLREHHLDHEWFNVSRQEAIAAVEKATTPEMLDWYANGHMIPVTLQPRTKILRGEHIYTKFPQGTKDRLRALLGSEGHSDFIRAAVLEALAAREANPLRKRSSTPSPRTKKGEGE